jgi:hypothetical protein
VAPMKRCVFQIFDSDGQRYRYRCSSCGRLTGWTRSPAARVKGDCDPTYDAGQKGPGTQFKLLTGQLGLHNRGGCNCDKLLKRMNEYGVAGCREHRYELLAYLHDNASRYGWTDKAKAGILAIRTGLLFRIDPFDPIGSLFDEAVRLADIASEARQ